MITVTIGIRETTFDVNPLRPVRIVDRYRSGDTTFEPADVWASPEAWEKARAQVEPAFRLEPTAPKRRRKA